MQYMGTCAGSLTPWGSATLAINDVADIAFRKQGDRRHPNGATFEAQYLTYTHPCQRLPFTIARSGHDSGPGWLANLSPHDIFSHTSIPDCPGASPAVA